MIYDRFLIQLKHLIYTLSELIFMVKAIYDVTNDKN